MSLTPEEHDYIGQVIAEDAAARKSRKTTLEKAFADAVTTGLGAYLANPDGSIEPADMSPVPPAGDVEVRDAFCAAYRELRGYAPLRVEGTNEYKIFTAGFDSRSAHVTRLTAERDGLKSSEELLRADLAWSENDCRDLMKERDALQSELTKALECISEAGVLLASRWIMPDDLSAWRKSASECLAHQSAPAAKVDCGNCAFVAGVCVTECESKKIRAARLKP